MRIRGVRGLTQKMCEKDTWKPSLTSTSKEDLKSIGEYMLDVRGAGILDFKASSSDDIGI